MQTGSSNLPVKALNLFQEHSKTTMARLLECSKGHRPEDLAKAAHALKSTSVNVGAVQLGAICTEIETRAKAGTSVSDLTHLVDRAVLAFEETEKALPGLIAHFQQSAA